MILSPGILARTAISSSERPSEKYSLAGIAAGVDQWQNRDRFLRLNRVAGRLAPTSGPNCSKSVRRN